MDARYELTRLRASMQSHHNAMRRLVTLTEFNTNSELNESNHQYELIIGILSARDHWKQRQALRDTWVGHALSTPGLRTR